MYKCGLILRGTIIAVFYNEVYVTICSIFTSVSNLFYIQYTTLVLLLLKMIFLKADLNKLWNSYCMETWTFIWHNPESNQLLGQRFGWPLR